MKEIKYICNRCGHEMVSEHFNIQYVKSHTLAFPTFYTNSNEIDICCKCFKEILTISIPDLFNSTTPLSSSDKDRENGLGLKKE